ncbi:hypothetical protein U5B43_04725 [Campylobacter sp. 9BO]|uniref:hypothetical protein n=1 Tax=Campylobacter sp. 9BO TaxID=3424759 RepID=UPI003D340229
MKKLLKRIFKKTNWYNLRNVQPISRVFGLDRGTPIDRVYIENFLIKNKHLIKGVVCEVAESTYSKKFNSGVTKFEILHYVNDNKNVTIVGDLTNISTIPKEELDCFILTQTLNFIYDFKSAIKGLHYILKWGG